jgi:hypothetical protein
MIKITHNGRPFDSKRFMAEIEAKAIEVAMTAIEARARGAASSIVDPETGRHADVFVDRLPGNKVAVRTTGSAAYARLLEDRLGVGAGEVKMVNQADSATHPKVYLAHASEDKAVVRPIAEYLMANGIEVWFDEWEIEPGDSLRQKMEEGFEGMTHFAVILTPVSITKPWVAREIDVGFVGLVGGNNRMVPLRVGTEIADLPRFLQTLLCEKLDPSSEQDLAALADRFRGISRKPALGPVPSHVKSVPAGLSGWSPAAVAVAQHLVGASKHAMSHDPITNIEDIAAAIGHGVTDVRLAVLDLKDQGLLWESGSMRGHIAPERGLFVEFDPHFMPFTPADDAVTVANRLVSADTDVTDTKALAEDLGWEARRMNSAICYLERANAIRLRPTLASTPWRSVHLIRSDQTLRFARSHA